MKKFYSIVATQKRNHGYAITLDGRPIKTPLKHDLMTSHEPLAQAIVQEWANQGDEILPDSMPLTQILNTCIDRVGKEREAITRSLCKYIDTDLLCYRTDNPSELGQKQAEIWDPYLTWFEEHFGAGLKTTHSIAALSQDQDAHDAVDQCIAALDDDHFTILQLIASVSGSVILGLAVLHDKINAQEIFKAMRVEEDFKAKLYNEALYGADPAQAEKDQAIQRELEGALEYLCLINDCIDSI